MNPDLAKSIQALLDAITLDENKSGGLLGRGTIRAADELRLMVTRLENPLSDGDRTDPLVFAYRNHRGSIGVRRARPLALHFGSTEWHPEPQWLLRAYDLDKNAERMFALADMGDPLFIPPLGGAPMETAPKDRLILVYAPSVHGLSPMFSGCRWHDLAGFCIDEFRSPEAWWPLPEQPPLQMEAAP